MARSTTGFLDEAEGLVLTNLAERAAQANFGPLVEIGAYLGRSTLFLAGGIAGSDTVLFSVDHHRGSEEMQPGWPHHEPSLVDPVTNKMDSLTRWRHAVGLAGVEHNVIAIVGESSLIAKYWQTPLGLVFIDGGHGKSIAWGDYLGWAPKLAQNAVLVIHDVFPSPSDGGRPPYEIYAHALRSGVFYEDESMACGSLRVLIKGNASQLDR